MYEGQQVLEAIFRQKVPEGKAPKPKIGVIEFDRNGIFHFVGNTDTFEGVRNFLAYHGVTPDADPLEAAVIIPADLVNGTAGGEAGTGKVKPPSDSFRDLDDLSDIKALKANPNGPPASPAPEGNRKPDLRGDGSQSIPAADPIGGGGPDHPTARAEGANTEGGNAVGSQAAVAADDDADFGAPDDADFNF